MSEKKENGTTLIHIDDKYAIKVGEIGYALVLKAEKSERPIGYYSSVAKCLTAYIKEHIHDTLDNSLERNLRLQDAVRLILNAVAECEKSIREAMPDYEVIPK